MYDSFTDGASLGDLEPIVFLVAVACVACLLTVAVEAGRVMFGASLPMRPTTLRRLLRGAQVMPRDLSEDGFEDEFVCDGVHIVYTVSDNGFDSVEYVTVIVPQRQNVLFTLIEGELVSVSQAGSPACTAPALSYREAEALEEALGILRKRMLPGPAPRTLPLAA